MKVTTANFKSSDYKEKHDVYIGSETGSFKKISIYNEKAYHAENLQVIESLTKDSKITSLSYGNDEQTEILVGRVNKLVNVYEMRNGDFATSLEMTEGPICGLARYNENLIAGFATGKVQISNDSEPIIKDFGDHMSCMRQCRWDRKLIATGGKGRQNCLKIFDINEMKGIFRTKNLPNDILQLEVPVWDSDFEFLSASTVVTCSRYGYVRFYDTRKQRRPIYNFAQEQQSWSSLAAVGNTVFVGSTMGALKCLDTRNLKTYLHNYKGFTGSVSDLEVDETGRYLISGSLDRYLRVHQTETCEMLYQCYCKSKVTRVLLKCMPEENKKDSFEDESAEIGMDLKNLPTNLSDDNSSDKEYEDLFKKMDTVSDETTLDLIDQRKRKIVDRSTKTKKNKTK